MTLKNSSLARIDDVRAGHEPQRAFKARRELNAGERALLSMLADLSSRDGVASASRAYMAAALDLSPRQVQRMLNGERRTLHGQLVTVRAGLVERGYVLAMPRRGRQTLYKLSGKPVDSRAWGETKTSRVGETKTSPNVLESNRDSAQGETQPLFDRVDFNVTRPMYSGDWMAFDKRLCVAFSNWSLFTHIEHQGHDRRILSCKRSSTAIVLQLAPVGEEQSAVELQIPFARIVEQRFFRLRHAGRRSRKES